MTPLMDVYVAIRCIIHQKMDFIAITYTWQIRAQAVVPLLQI